MDINYRALTPQDSADYRSLRLESLRLNPDCFCASYSEQVQLPQLYFEKLIADSDPAHIMLGAFHGQQLIGLCGLSKRSPETAAISQMYVNPSYRGQGIGAGLLRLAKELGRTQLQVSGLSLVVLAANQRAIKTYQASGFQLDSSESQSHPQQTMTLAL